jgi:hypothetical protein
VDVSEEEYKIRFNSNSNSFIENLDIFWNGMAKNCQKHKIRLSANSSFLIFNLDKILYKMFIFYIRQCLFDKKRPNFIWLKLSLVNVFCILLLNSSQPILPQTVACQVPSWKYRKIVSAKCLHIGSPLVR